MVEGSPATGDGQTVACRICGAPVPAGGASGSRNPQFACRACGTYRLSEYAAHRLYEATRAADGRVQLFPDHHLLSAAIRERSALVENERYVTSLDELLAAARPLPGGFLEAADRLLLFAGEHLPRLGEAVQLVLPVDYPVAYARDGTELAEIAKLGYELGYITFKRAGDTLLLTITAAGWQRLQELRTRQIQRQQAFVAMWFADEMTLAFTDGIEPALRATGYRALRIDRVEHNDKVDDRIVAAIRQSGLLVADFTGNRGGVYFEAGFAMGLGLPVIWTCRRDHFDQYGVHFDTRQYNHIVWEDAADLREWT